MDYGLRIQQSDGQRNTTSSHFEPGISEHTADHAASVDDDSQFAFFEKGRDFESVYTSHKYTQKEENILATFDSVDYFPSHSHIFRNWLKRQASRVEWDKWVMMGLIGLSVGFIGFLLHQFIALLSSFKWQNVQLYIGQKQNFALSWSIISGFGLAFSLLSSACVVLWRPSAIGSGIPELIGFLNGTLIPRALSVPTLVAKFLSCMLAVSSGLPVGPEGPMIHMGAMVGSALSQLQVAKLSMKVEYFKRFRNPQDRRDFVSAGAAAGVASAFGAPTGGMLFVMEEVASFWNQQLSWRIFFSCMVATFTTDLFNSAFQKFGYRGEFGIFRTENYILFKVKNSISLNILAVIPAVVLGAIGGILGGIFVVINLKLARFRRTLLARLKTRSAKRISMICDAVIITVVFGTICLFLPMLFSCTNFSCEEQTGDNYYCRVNGSEELELGRYTCPESIKNGSQLRSGSYNQVAGLLLSTGEDGIHQLFSRKTYKQFGLSELAAVFVFYYIFAAISAGTPVSTGLVVPMLMIGGLFGRFLGELLAQEVGTNTIESDPYWAWADPGALALIGAAAFFGGVSRLTISLTIIMIEITNDIQFLLLFMIAIMVAKWVGDLFTHPLYHSLLELKCIPFLDTQPTVYASGGGTSRSKPINLDLFEVGAVMTRPVVTLTDTESVQRVAQLLVSTTHGGFPVTATGHSGATFLGLITRTELYVLLVNKDVFSDSVEENAQSDVTYVEYPQFATDYVPVENIKEKLQELASDLDNSRKFIKLKPYINSSAVSVQEHFSLHRAYILFRNLGLRHLVVTNMANEVSGIITRKDFMGFSLERRITDSMGPSRISADNTNPNENPHNRAI